MTLSGDKRGEVFMNQDPIRMCLERMGGALSTTNLPDLVDCWELPAMILTDEGAIALTEADSLVSLFARAAQGYQSQGLVATRSELELVEPLSEKLTAVEVGWRGFDAAGPQQANERSNYMLRLGADGQQRIRVALTKTK